MQRLTIGRAARPATLRGLLRPASTLASGPSAVFGKTVLGADFDPIRLNDRIDIMESTKEKGWLVGIEWKTAPNHGGGMGAFATEDVSAGTLIRRSAFEGGNFIQMSSYEDLAAFCGIGDPKFTDAQRDACKAYLTDYLFRAQPIVGTTPPDDQRTFGVWLPGCGDNCVNPGELPNVEDRLIEEGTVMGMYAKRDIKKGEPLLSDYDNDYGVPPDWIARFAKDHLDSKIVFAGMNHNSAGFSSIGGA